MLLLAYVFIALVAVVALAPMLSGHDRKLLRDTHTELELLRERHRKLALKHRWLEKEYTKLTLTVESEFGVRVVEIPAKPATPARVGFRKQ